MNNGRRNGAAIMISIMLVATAVGASAPCDHKVKVLGLCCDSYKNEISPAEGWFYNTTTNTWEDRSGSNAPRTTLIKLKVDGEEYLTYCYNLTALINVNDSFNASIYRAEPSCRNNSIAYMVNKWLPSCENCSDVSEIQSAIWYFYYVNESFCREGMPKYNHTARPGEPGWESYWIPNCTAQPKACDLINETINQGVPYNITLKPKSGNFSKGEQVVLEATVSYCSGNKSEVTVVFETDKGKFVESNQMIYENNTVNGKASATLVYDGVDTVNVTARVKGKKWFEIIDPRGCQPKKYQDTIRFINITDDAQFNFTTIIVKKWLVEGHVYEDRSCNCSYESPEPGVPDVTVELVNATTGEVVNRTKTDSGGYYNFTNVSPGDYKVRYDENDLPSYLRPKCDDDGGNATEGNIEVPPNQTHNFAVKAMVGIRIEKLVNGENSITAARNDTVTFTLNITNTGEANLTNLSVHDAFPLKKANKGLTWTGWADPPALPASSTDPSGWVHFTLDWPNLTQFEPLEPGESFVITFNATVDPEAEGMYCDVAYVTAKGEGWCINVTDNDDACVFVETKRVPPIRVPVLTPIGIAALIGLLSLVVAHNLRRKERK